MANNIYPKSFNGQGPQGHVNTAGTAIEITSLIAQETVRFIPFLTAFNDNHDASWSAEQVYGRMDDVISYQRTKRTIQIGFDVPSESEDEAIQNFKNLSLMKQFMYPVYAESNNALSLKGAPLFRVKFANLINSSVDPKKGLLSTISKVNFSPNNEAGFYIINAAIYPNRDSLIIPKLFSIDFEMNVLHEFTPGWDANKNFGANKDQSSYPYRMNSLKASTDISPESTQADGQTSVTNVRVNTILDSANNLQLRSKSPFGK